MSPDAPKPLIAVHSLVYNHEAYLHDYFRGLLMQQTNFPYIAIVHDDASTDGSADIIRAYAEKHPDIIKPIFESENLYSKDIGLLKRKMQEAAEAYGVKYIAVCEGDDYWNDPLKLQKQVDYMETHPDCYMTGCDVHFLTNEGEDVSRVRFKTSRRLSRYEAITKAGYVYTVGTVYRRDLLEGCPAGVLNCHVGDYPRQIMAALKGYIYIFGEKMATYRYAMGNSWTATRLKNIDEAKKLRAWRSELIMLDEMNRISQGRYADLFCWRKGIYARHLRKLFPFMSPAITDLFRCNFAAHYWGDAPSLFRRLRNALILRLSMQKAKLR
ncbi:MAG: glycosyltransferase [Akkermansia sp.]|nr:glycosyltransferase [Akkermansia sp.]